MSDPSTTGQHVNSFNATGIRTGCEGQREDRRYMSNVMIISRNYLQANGGEQVMGSQQDVKYLEVVTYELRARHDEMRDQLM